MLRNFFELRVSKEGNFSRASWVNMSKEDAMLDCEVFNPAKILETGKRGIFSVGASQYILETDHHGRREEKILGAAP